VPKTVAYARRCAARSGVLLEHISTKDTVRDLDYLRWLVGDTLLNYRGLSYGTVIGQTYANMFPDRVRAMIIDGLVVRLRSSSLSRRTSRAESDTPLVFEQLSLCEQAGPARCGLAGRGPVAPPCTRC
jgi:pimeloyl-ACP methyl ester carboxylesterase